MNEHFEKLIHLKLTSEISAQEEQDLMKWIEESDENRAEYEAYIQMWNQLDAAQEKIDLDKAYSKFQRKLHTSSERTSFSWIAAAAVILISMSYYLFFNSSTISVETNNIRKEFALDDGSKIKLNRNSTVEYEYTDDERRIILDGEGLFQVEKDGRPFIVETENSVITVLGTKFNVSSKMNTTTVTVIEGRVEFRDRHKNGKRVILERGMKSDSHEYDIDSNGFSSSISWLNDRIIFNDISLSEIAERLEHEFSISVKIESEPLKMRRITASLSDKNAEDILQALSNLLEVEVHHEKGVYIIR